VSKSLRWGEPVGAWWALFACTLTVVLASGTRSSLAAFLKPIEAELGLDRITLSNVGAITVLTYGLVLPLVGRLAARYGARPVLMTSVAIMALGGFGVAFTESAWQLYLFAGFIPGVAYGGATQVPGTVLLAKWFKKRLGLAAGILTSGVPAGPSLFVPLAVALIPLYGWRATYVLLGVLLACVALPALWWAAREPPDASTPARARASGKVVGIGLDVWLIGLGYFACGFTDQFISLHFVTLATEGGVEPLAAASAYSLLLVAGVAGSIISGPLADAMSPKLILAGIYLIRALTLPLLLWLSPTSGFIILPTFALTFGLTFISNQAPGARYVRDHYGVQAVGPLMGSVGLGHQIGGAMGIILGGLSVTYLGGYWFAILAAAGVALVGGVLQFSIRPRQAVSV
jgi:MFS family permease